jgi:hypothetical protein
VSIFGGKKKDISIFVRKHSPVIPGEQHKCTLPVRTHFGKERDKGMDF